MVLFSDYSEFEITEGAVNNCMAICKWVSVKASSGNSSSSKIQASDCSIPSMEVRRDSEFVRQKNGHVIVLICFFFTTDTVII